MSDPRAAEDVVSFYQRKGEDWNAARRSQLFVERPWIDRFCALMRPGGTVLDIGCGSGEPIAEYLVAQRFEVCGLDSSGPLLARARARRPTQEWIEADMRTFALNRRFDGIVLWDSFFHLAHDAQRDMFPRLASHAAPHAPLLLTSGPHHGEAVGEMFGESVYHASLAPDEYRILFAANGFEEVSYAPEDAKTGGRTIWLARRTD